MKKVHIPFAETHQFSNLVDDYLQGNASLKPFYNESPSIDSFGSIIDRRNNFNCNRETLHKAILAQYGDLLNTKNEGAEKVLRAVNSLLDAKTFTVTTGHQLNLYTGALYSIYKILSTIKLAEAVSKKHPAKNIVPVFWMASEDHDFDEINHFKVYNNKLVWDVKSGGAVGRMKTEGMQKVVDELKSVIGEEHEFINKLNDCYLHSLTLAEATRKLIHLLFGEFGLVIIDGDDPALKALFVPEMMTELQEEKSFTAVQTTNVEFEKLYKIQVHPREINLFYLGANSRERIIKSDDGNYCVQNTALVFTPEQIQSELKNYPEKFSPNVVLRPLYQEKILPNLAYIGGPGELNYWLQFKGVFEAFKIPYPIVLLRNCMLWIDNNTLGKLEKLNLIPADLFSTTDFLILKILEDSVDFHPDTGMMVPVINKIYGELASEFDKLDSSLVPTVESEKQKALNGLKVLEEKARRSLKKKNETLVNQLKNLKEKLMPGGALQERTDNFIPFYLNFKGEYLKELYNNIDPVATEFIILIED